MHGGYHLLNLLDIIRLWVWSRFSSRQISLELAHGPDGIEIVERADMAAVKARALLRIGDHSISASFP